MEFDANTPTLFKNQRILYNYLNITHQGVFVSTRTNQPNQKPLCRKVSKLWSFPFTRYKVPFFTLLLNAIFDITVDP